MGQTLIVTTQKVSRGLFDWQIYIWPWAVLNVKVKVLLISTVNTSKTVTDTTHNTIANAYKVAPSLSIDIGQFRPIFDLGPF